MHNEERLKRLIEEFAAQPDKGLPQMFGDASQLEGAYRFLRNEHIDPDALLAAHASETKQRAAQARRVVVAHDTTAFVFGGERRELGRVVGKGRGFFGHFALAIDAATAMPLGVVHCEAVMRGDQVKSRKKVGPDDATNEALRWNRAARATHEMLQDAVHVMDREADSYALLAEMLERQQRFVVRLSQRERRAEGGPIGELLAGAPVVAEREVSLGARKAPPGPASRKRHPARHSRKATLEISAYQRAELLRPLTCGANYAPRIVINVVRVLEKEPPAGTDPVEWLLYTSLPVDTPDQILSVVDAYRQRWLIEEFFKALKTGCIYEQRQLESLHGLLVVLALSVPVAWHLLRLRTMVRTDPNAPAASMVSAAQIACLRHELGQRVLPPHPTTRDVLLAIARLGGHLRNNGDPGWLTLSRGFHDLKLLERGYQARGDQS
ncbi:MAG: IS4 family transposase [Deltaproteobacteria bacterium]|nr:IS4 family transposase [Deltaproteobacteria bacterium]